MNKAVYFDLFAGCSGDMILGGLLDAGLPLEQLADALAALPLAGYRIKQRQVKRGAMAATLAQVVIESTSPEHDRSFGEITKLISVSHLPASIKTQAGAVFRNLGEAEAKIHDVALEKVHFHEVGAVDSIVDIVGALIGFELLGVTHFYSSPFPVAGGSVVCRHGTLPLPAPAALSLLAARSAPVVKPSIPGMEGHELVTPTGAAIVASLAKFERPSMNLERIGHGAGGRNPAEYPNVLRLWIGELAETEQHGGMVLLETNIDDMNPQLYDYVMDKLFKQGALDVWITPIQMKKNRPAVMLSVLSPCDLEGAMAETIIRETTTLGIRVRPVFRHIADRESRAVNSIYGRVNVKIKLLKGSVISISPEYEDCRRIAAEKDTPLKEVYRRIEAEARQQLI
jgi:uncharacterized protein (TIGR00299 family) protein